MYPKTHTYPYFYTPYLVLITMLTFPRMKGFPCVRAVVNLFSELLPRFESKLA